MAEDTLMETDGGDNITREQVLVEMQNGCDIQFVKGLGSDEREGSFGS